MQTAHALSDAVAIAPLPRLETAHVAVIGLGYVGLPLAAALGRRLTTLGYDIDAGRIEALRSGHDTTRQVDGEELGEARRLSLSHQAAALRRCNVYIVTVPTPVDRYKRPDLSLLEAASREVGRYLSRGDVVVYESTVYPGASEEFCAPILESASGLRVNHDFHLGYSPERINPGDGDHRLSGIAKVVAASNGQALDFLHRLYALVVEAGVHRASSIRVAEAAKVIENTQRDVNIALINELAMLFNRLGLNTREVLDAAATKWNFLPFRPGLVGGHCIGVDPYYLTHKAQEIGFFAEMILAGRRINDGMARYVVDSLVTLMTCRRLQVVGAHILVLGATFKENCPDLRNSQVSKMVELLRGYQASVDVHDPWVAESEMEAHFGTAGVTDPQAQHYDAVVLAVPHEVFLNQPAERLRGLTRPGGVIYDVKGVLPEGLADGSL